MWKRDRGGGRARAEARRDLMARSSSSGGMKKLGRATSGTPALEEAHINGIKVTPRLHTPHKTSLYMVYYKAQTLHGRKSESESGHAQTTNIRFIVLEDVYLGFIIGAIGCCCGSVTGDSL